MVLLWTGFMSSINFLQPDLHLVPRFLSQEPYQLYVAKGGCIAYVGVVRFVKEDGYWIHTFGWMPSWGGHWDM